ncbi:hypothetical protein B1756_06985 [Natrarchaeobaculum aegyptiacum]|uniref:Uncharacterized protein n=1 Tax=Natrarchaeobaculum aegyptiacum TaxID=745377 RepID=A0A2Z2HWX6_9EURY|nr:hypothetical protein B1756_06985 [Natrarchaeobaculum aegyptiacum]
MPTGGLARRRFLAAAGATASVALAGCATVVDFLAGMVLDDVNLMNGTDQVLTGSIVVRNPDGETVLDDSFEVEPDEDDGGPDPDEESQAVFGDVFDGPGEYTVEIELDEDSAIDGETEATLTATVDDPEEEHIIVLLGAPEHPEPVDVVVIENFSEMAERLEE